MNGDSVSTIAVRLTPVHGAPGPVPPLVPECSMSFPINRVAVIGAGVMGSGIAAQFTNAGVPVLLLDIVPPNLTDAERGRKDARNRFAADAVERMKKKSKPPVDFYHPDNAKLITVGNLEDDFAALGDVDWIVEVVAENLQIKQSLYERIEAVRKPRAIVSSNTSGIALAKLVEGRSSGFKQHFLITHFFNPPTFLKLYEVISGPETLPEVTAFAAEFGEKRLGKGVVYAKDTANFIGNRIGVAGIAGTFKYLEELDLTIEEVDAVTGKILGRAMPVFKTTDLVGLDTMSFVMKNAYEALTDADETRSSLTIPAWVQALLDAGMKGNKSGGGFYKKEKGEGGKKSYVWDWKTRTYRDEVKVRADSLKIANNTDDPRERLAYFLFQSDKYANLAWRMCTDMWRYCSARLDEITDDIVQIDNAMKWGYNWTLGPYEMWDAAGVKKTTDRMRAEGLPVPAVADQLLGAGAQSFYKLENGVRYFWDHKSGAYKAIPGQERTIDLPARKTVAGAVVKRNSSATLLDIGDGVLLCEFHSKMNAIDDDIIRLLLDAADLLDAGPTWRGLVIGNQAENFSVGANLGLIMMLAMGGQFELIEQATKGLQDASMRLRYCSKPTVAAGHGMALGGGCEVLMATDAAVVHSLSFIGLVEIGAGLVPGGGGHFGVLTRYLENIPAGVEIDRFAFVRAAFEQIAQAKVSNSGELAREMRYLRPTDRVVANRDDLIPTAKRMVLGMDAAGYTAPKSPANLILPGRPGYATFEMGLYNMRLGGWVTDHEVKIASKIAHILTGGDIQPNTAVSETRIMELEREAFMSLVGEPKSIERMQALLKTGKPLRN